MQAITTIGLDIAKSVFQVHGVDADGQVVIRRQLKRRYVLAFFQKLSPCLVGIEACASSHHWSRELKFDHHMRRQRAVEPHKLEEPIKPPPHRVGLAFLDQLLSSKLPVKPLRALAFR
jgi:hypothetical protein